MSPYPPERNVWQFPPPPVSRRWFWVAILAVVASLIAAVGLGVTGAIIASKDFPSLIQNHQLITVIGHECQIMTESIESMPVEGNQKQQVGILADQNQAVELMLEAVRMIDDGTRAADQPTDKWLLDWDRLIVAREHYADLVGRGLQPNLRIPRDADGDFIYVRMNDVWLVGSTCRVPSDLLSPYPKDIEGV